MLVAQKYYRDFISLLNKHGVQYILVGGAAVHSHGYERYTGDVDLWVNPIQENMEKLFIAIREFGFDTSSLVTHKFSEKDAPIKLVEDGRKIDIIHHLTNAVTFEEAWAHVTKEKKEDFYFYLISYYHLLQIKKAAGRPKDLADVDELIKFHAVQTGTNSSVKTDSIFKKILNKITRK